jgi:hypothetical protein
MSIAITTAMDGSADNTMLNLIRKDHPILLSTATSNIMCDKYRAGKSCDDYVIKLY